MSRFLYIFLVIFSFLFSSINTTYAASDPILLRSDQNPKDSSFCGAIGPIFKYKRVSGPYNFGGDMLVWGIRGYFGKNNAPKLGVEYQTGSLTGTGFKFNLDMGGLTLEDSFKEDSRVKWRVGFGGGKYKMSTRNSGYIVNKGSFTYIEPMIVGVLPATRNIALEFGAGYTFAGATGVRIEGVALQAELLFGKF